MATPHEIFDYTTSIAVVGASSNSEKPGGEVPLQLQRAGFRIIPVNPNEETILGERTYPRLDQVPVHVDTVEVFRPAEEAPDIARQAVGIGARALWLQLGIKSDEARRIAEEAGLDYVEDTCMGEEQARYGVVKR